MAEVERFINTASTPGGDGTTNATSGANRAYASASEWEAAEQTDLVTDGDTHLVHAEGSTADNATCTISGWTTGSSNYITFIVDEDVRHNGQYSSSFYRISFTNPSTVFYIGQTYTIVEGVQVLLYATISGRSGIQPYADGIHIRDCVVRGVLSDAAVNCRGITCYNAGMDIYVYNNMVENFINGANANYGIYTRVSTISAVYQNTVVNCYDCYWTDNAGVAWKNNVAQDASNAGYTGTAHADSTNNLSNLADAFGSNPINSKTLTFVNKAGGNYHLASTDTDAIDAGADLSADGRVAITDDIDGDTRSSYDVGMDEYVGGGGMTLKTSYWGDI